MDDLHKDGDRKGSSQHAWCVTQRHRVRSAMDGAVQQPFLDSGSAALSKLGSLRCSRVEEE